MNKKGISVVSLSVTIVILLVILSTISISITYSVANARKLTFAKEIYNIQSLVTEYIQKENVLPVSTDTIQIQIQPSATEQFGGEKITDGKLLLNVLDLTELDIVNTNYGNKKTGEADVYAVSAETRKVYYIAGFKDNDKTYYTLTEDLLKMIEKKQDLLISERTIIFTPSKLGWSNEAISVRVTVPETYEITSFAIDNENIKYTQEKVDNEKIYNVNLDKVLENYVITVDYTKNGVEGKIKYKTKLDLTQPSIVKDENVTNTSTAIKGLNATDTESGVKYFKYAEGIINDYNVQKYMKAYGRNINKRSIKMKTKSVYTLYAEDKAGNVSVLHVDGDGNRFYPNLATAIGENELILSNSYNLSLINYTIRGNSVQDGLPSPTTPVEIQSVGELVTDETDEHFGKYNIPITVSGNNIADLSKVIPATTTPHVKFKYDNTTGTIEYTNNRTKYDYLLLYLERDIGFKFEQGKTYYWGAEITVSGKQTNDNTVVNFGINYSNSRDNGYTYSITENKTFKASGSFVYDGTQENIRLHIHANYGSIEPAKVKFENIFVSEDNKFEPYIQPKTYNIYMSEPLRKVGEDSDYIDFKEGKIVRNINDKKLTSNLPWMNDYYPTLLFLVGKKEWAKGDQKTAVMSKYCSDNYYLGITNVSGAGLGFKTSNNYWGFTTLDDLKKWLDEKNDMVLYYPLATAMEEKINLPDIKLNYGTNIIKVGTTIAPSQTDITYYKKQ